MTRKILSTLLSLLLIMSPSALQAIIDYIKGDRTLSNIVQAPNPTSSKQALLQAIPAVNLTITTDLPDYLNESWANASVTIDGTVEGYVTSSSPFTKELPPDRNYTIGVTSVLIGPGTCVPPTFQFVNWNHTQSLSENPITLFITEDTLLEAHYGEILADPAPANIRILSPRDGALLTATKNITVTASSGSNIRALALSVDGREVQRYVKGNTTSTIATFSFNASGLPLGKHALTVSVAEGCFMFDEGRHTIHVYIGSYGITPLEIAFLVILPVGIFFTLRRKSLKRSL